MDLDSVPMTVSFCALLCLYVDLSLSVYFTLYVYAHMSTPMLSFAAILCVHCAILIGHRCCHFFFLGYKMNKRVGAIEEFEFLPLSPGKHLHVTVAVTGWLCSGKYS